MAFDPKIHRAEYRPTIVSKLSAGRRQLDCAIEMWFVDRDQVAVHTLAVAAHQIIHDIHEEKFPDKPLLLNIPIADEKKRGEFIGIFKEAANFFKHAERDPSPGSTIEFSPFLTQVFFLSATVGLQNLGEDQSDTQKVYQMWFTINHPEFTNPEIVRQISKIAPQSFLNEARNMDKREFYSTAMQAAASQRIR